VNQSFIGGEWNARMIAVDRNFIYWTEQLSTSGEQTIRRGLPDRTRREGRARGRGRLNGIVAPPVTRG
jgi:hypothetical protein